MPNIIDGLSLESVHGRIRTLSKSQTPIKMEGAADVLILDINDAASVFEQMHGQYLIRRHPNFKCEAITDNSIDVSVRLNDGRIISDRLFTLMVDRERVIEMVSTYPLLGLNLIKDVIQNRIYASAAWNAGEYYSNLKILCDYMDYDWYEKIVNTTNPDLIYQQEATVEGMFRLFDSLILIVDEFISSNPWLVYTVEFTGRAIKITRGMDFRILDWHRIQASKKT